MVEITLGTDVPGILRSVHVFVTDEAGGLWQFEVIRYVTDTYIGRANITGSIIVKEAMFAMDDNSVFSDAGAIPVPMNIRMELARNFEQVTLVLYADNKTA